MADVSYGLDPGTNSGDDPSTVASYAQAGMDAIIGSMLDSGGNITGNTGGGAAQGNPYSPYVVGGYSSAPRYAPYDEGGGHTKWDEFVQQMAYNNAKLAQDKALEEERLKNAMDIANVQAQQQKYNTDTGAVGDFNKMIAAQQGPKDPYGYLFASRGLAAPQGYAPVAMPLAQGVADMYKSQGIDLADAQKAISGGSGPSFINGMLGSMPTQLQQGPMGFQNTPNFTNVAPGSQPQGSQSETPPQPPVQAANGGVIPGYSPGNDSVPAMLSPGEGVLKPQTVQALGGPQAVDALNAQHFADGGTVQPLYQQPLTDLGNGLLQRGFETGTARAKGPYTSSYDATYPGIPVRSSAAPTGDLADIQFGNSGGFHITGAPVQGSNNFAPNNPQGSTSWYPVQLDDGRTGYISGYDLQNSGFTMPQTGTKESLNPDLPQGYQLQSAGVATQSSPAPGGQSWVGQLEDWFNQQGLGNPGSPPGSLPPIGSNPGIGSIRGVSTDLGPAMQPPPPVGSNPSSPLLTGGVLNSPGPVNGPPMNLNNLDPYTRSLVDQYGRPQIPSMAAWNSMPQSGKDAFQNYVEKVAGGNMQDLLDQQQQTAAQGDVGALSNSLSFNS